MNKEKNFKINDRISICFVYPTKSFVAAFACMYFIPTILTYSLNNQNYSPWLFTRFTGLHFLSFSIEIAVSYGRRYLYNVKG